MDGLTISTSDALLETGRTTSQLRDAKLKVDSLDSDEIKESGGSFASTLKEAVSKVNDLQKDADVKMQKLATGDSKNIPEVLIAAERADVAFKLMMQVRNKIVDAYKEIMKMQV